MIEVILFVVSITVIITLLAFRSFEVKRRKDFISPSLRERSDDFILKIWNKVSTFISKIWKMVFLTIKKGLKFILHIFVSIWEFFVHKSTKYIDMIRGKGIISNRGSASYFTSLDEENDLQN